MAFGEDAGKATWEIGAVYVIENSDDQTQVGAIRRPKPGPGRRQTGHRALGAHAFFRAQGYFL